MEDNRLVKRAKEDKLVGEKGMRPAMGWIDSGYTSSDEWTGSKQDIYPAM